MKKAEFIERYGKEAYAQMLEQAQARYKAHPSEHLARTRQWDKANRVRRCAISQKWQKKNLEKVKVYNRKKYPELKLELRKGGKYYEQLLEYQQTGLPGERHKIRMKHGYQYRPFKMIIAPESQIHHEWIPNTAKYRGLALVEAKPHQYGIINVIQILDGKITVLTEEEVKNGKKKVRPNVEN